MPRPLSSEYGPYFETYVGKVPEADILPLLRTEFASTLAFLSGISEADSTLRHAPYTWSARQVVGHLVDGERIFAYRALRFARGDSTPLPGFDENAYVAAAGFDDRTLNDLVAEFATVRSASVSLFESLGNDPAAWDRRGVANNAELSVRALAYIIVGHERHHISILRKRFGR